MPSLVAAVVTGAVAVSLVVAVPTAQSPSSSTAPAPGGGAEPASPAQFEGTWTYSADDSVNAYTGRPEQAPTRAGANARSGSSGSSGGRPGQPGGTGSGNPVGTPTGGNPGGYPGPVGTGSGTQGPPAAGSGMPGMGGMGSGMGGPPPGGIDSGGYRGWAVQWARSAQRDLLEVPWSLTIDVTDDAVTFVDDLERSRTYLTNSKRKKYQLGAAVFHAKTYWDGGRLRKDIDAAGSFKMTETYFLSEDASRLFVIIRIGDPKQANARNAPLDGVNRVYDRAQR